MVCMIFLEIKLRTQDGIEPVQKIVGGWDNHTKNYILSIQKNKPNYKTVSFDEGVQGWTSFFSFKPSLCLV